MNIKRVLFLGLLTYMLIFIGTSTAWAFLGHYGKLRPRWLSPDKVSMEEVSKNWERYDIYYAGPHAGFPSAIMFDPKLDDKKLTPHDNWVKVTNRDVLSNLMTWIRAVHSQFYPVLWRIHSPENQVYGYMYTSAWTHAVIKVVDGKTMWVDDIPLPPIDYGP